MSDPIDRINEARQRSNIAELNKIMDEVDAELGGKEVAENDTTVDAPEPDVDPKALANNLVVNGRTGGHTPQIKKAARYIDATLR